MRDFGRAIERIQRRIVRVLGQAEKTTDQAQGDAVREYPPAAPGLDPDNPDALAFLDSARLVHQTLTGSETPTNPAGLPLTQIDQPYLVTELMGGGGIPPARPR